MCSRSPGSATGATGAATAATAASVEVAVTIFVSVGGNYYVVYCF
jgi:hypothetical protein